MSDSTRSRNLTALALLVIGKLLGIGGLVVGVMGHRVLGGLMLGLYGLFLAVAVGLCVVTMKRRQREDVGNKEVLAQMVREGTLDQYLRDVKAAETRAARDDERRAPRETAFS